MVQRSVTGGGHVEPPLRGGDAFRRDTLRQLALRVHLPFPTQSSRWILDHDFVDDCLSRHHGIGYRDHPALPCVLERFPANKPFWSAASPGPENMERKRRKSIGCAVVLDQVGHGRIARRQHHLRPLLHVALRIDPNPPLQSGRLMGHQDAVHRYLGRHDRVANSHHPTLGSVLPRYSAHLTLRRDALACPRQRFCGRVFVVLPHVGQRRITRPHHFSRGLWWGRRLRLCRSPTAYQAQ